MLFYNGQKVAIGCKDGIHSINLRPPIYEDTQKCVKTLPKGEEVLLETTNASCLPLQQGHPKHLIIPSLTVLLKIPLQPLPLRVAVHDFGMYFGGEVTKGLGFVPTQSLHFHLLLTSHTVAEQSILKPA
ncbi:hypothetical protein DXG01_006779 [Tephrocybe rancida]|nr:hypothetical protein DXG01_006779 [Tephrocybe rancida]